MLAAGAIGCAPRFPTIRRWTVVIDALIVSLLMMWRLEAMLDHGLEGTALGTIIMPYCSGLGNLIFVGLVVARGGPAKEVLTNCLVNNVTNLTLILGLPALLWGLALVPSPAAARAGRRRGGSTTGRNLHEEARERTHEPTWQSFGPRSRGDLPDDGAGRSAVAMFRNLRDPDRQKVVDALAHPHT